MQTGSSGFAAPRFRRWPMLTIHAEGIYEKPTPIHAVSQAKSRRANQPGWAATRPAHFQIPSYDLELAGALIGRVRRALELPVPHPALGRKCRRFARNFRRFTRLLQRTPCWQNSSLNSSPRFPDGWHGCDATSNRKIGTRSDARRINCEERPGAMVLTRLLRSLRKSKHLSASAQVANRWPQPRTS